MCFSARVSFFAVGLLVCVAIAAYKKVRGFNEIPLASIPLIFALQQMAEGFLWLLLPPNKHPDLIAVCMYFYLVCALVIWPVYIPLALTLIETHPLRKALMGFCLILGSAWSLASLWYLVHMGASVHLQSCHIRYAVPGLESITWLLLYCIAVLVPFLVSSSFLLRLVGSLIGVACVLSYLIWYYYFTSVWCFFAALISLGIYAVIVERTKDLTPKQSAS